MHSSDFVDPRASFNKKKASNFKRQKNIIDMYCSSGVGLGMEKDRQKKFSINYDLLNGRVDVDTLYDGNKTHKIMGETFTLDSNEIIHYPLIAQIGQAMIGEQIKRPFSLAVKDLSPMQETFKTKEAGRILKQNIQIEYVNPQKERIAQNLLQELNIEDPLGMDPEQQKQLQAEISSRYKAMSPKDLNDYLENDYRNPVAKQGQEVLNFLAEDLNIREETLDGFIHALPTGEEYYYVDVHRDDLVFESVMPEELKYGGSPHKVWVQDMDWAVRTQWLTLPDIVEKYAEYLTPTQIKELEGNVQPISDIGNAYTHKKWTEKLGVKLFMAETSKNGEHYQKKFNNLDTRTKEGHSNAMKIYGDIMGGHTPSGNMQYISSMGLKVEHCVWKDDALYYKVERYDVETNSYNPFWAGENYEEVEGDKVTKVWLKEVWQGTRIAGEHFVKIEPIKYQWPSASTPYGTQLPYIGKKYFTYKNRTKNRAPIDAGKTFQRDFDIQMSNLKHKLKTNFGKIFPYHVDMKPDKMSQKEFFTLIKDFGFLPVQDKKHGSSPVDSNMFKSIDVSKMTDIVETINLLQFFKTSLYESMYFSSARLGSASQYANTTNINSQQQASTNQTEPINETHRIIVEKALQSLMDKARLHYKDHPEQVEHILSPVSLMELKAGREFYYSELGVVLENSGFEQQQIEFLKQQMTQFISGMGGAGLDLILELTMANSKSEIINIVRKQQKQLTEAQAQAQQFEMQREQAASERIMQAQQATQQFEYQKHQEILASQEKRAFIQSETLLKANDANRDEEPDSITVKKLQLEFDREELAMKSAIDMAKNAKQ